MERIRPLNSSHSLTAQVVLLHFCKACKSTANHKQHYTPLGCLPKNWEMNRCEQLLDKATKSHTTKCLTVSLTYLDHHLLQSYHWSIHGVKLLPSVITSTILKMGSLHCFPCLFCIPLALHCCHATQICPYLTDRIRLLQGSFDWSLIRVLGSLKISYKKVQATAARPKNWVAYLLSSVGDS